MKITKEFRGVPNGEIYPVTFQPGDECPPELEATARHFGALAEDGPPTREALDGVLAMLPDGHTDSDYVVRSLRSHFGDLFTDDDEKFVRELVKAPAKKPSDGLKVEDLKAALAAKNIEIPEGMTLKADLAALLDGAA